MRKIHIRSAPHWPGCGRSEEFEPEGHPFVRTEYSRSGDSAAMKPHLDSPLTVPRMPGAEDRRGAPLLGPDGARGGA